ncbi:slightly ste11-like protein [Rhizina undulata]
MTKTAAATAVEEAGVLRSLLEEDHDPHDPISDVSLMPNASSAAVAAAAAAHLDMNAMVVQQQQQRAAAALQQADAAAKCQQHVGSQSPSQIQLQHQHLAIQHQYLPILQQQQQQQQQQQSMQVASPQPSVPNVLPHQPILPTSQAPPPVAMSLPHADPEGESLFSPAPVDIPLPTISPPTICLCQQPARIPRPRNAFILFRQHNHAAVVAKYPGKPNPEISKIIGEMWRESPQETRDIWQKHADEEKKQHLQRFPEYRYQPRRNGKKNAAAAAAALSAASSSGAATASIETAFCQTCGGRTGALSSPQPAITPNSAAPKPARLQRPPQSSRQPATSTSKKKRQNIDDNASRVGAGGGNGNISGGGGGVDQAGVEALLQLGHLQNEEDSVRIPDLQTPIKRRRLNESSPPAVAVPALPAQSPIQHNIYIPHFTQSHDPNIDPFLRQSGFESESPTTTALDNNGSLGSTQPQHHHHQVHQVHQINHHPQIPNFSPESTEAFIIKSIPIIDKIHAFTKICRPLPTPQTSGVPRMPVISVEGDEVEAVQELFTVLEKEMSRTEEVAAIDERDELSDIADASDIEGLLNGDKDSDDRDCAKYLNHVASWRRKCAEIKRIVEIPPLHPVASSSLDHTSTANRAAAAAPFQQGIAAGKIPALVLLNRYVVSRSDVAALRLPLEGLTPIQHWQWCATLWKGCVGPDMVIYVHTVPEGGVLGDDAVEVKECGRIVFVRKEAGRGKEWEEKIVRRLGFEVMKVIRVLRGKS